MDPCSTNLVVRSQAGGQACREVRIHAAGRTMTTLSVQPQRIPGVKSLISSHPDILKTWKRRKPHLRGAQCALPQRRSYLGSNKVTWVQDLWYPSASRAKLSGAPPSSSNRTAKASSADPKPSLDHTGLSKATCKTHVLACLPSHLPLSSSHSLH